MKAYVLISIITLFLSLSAFQSTIQADLKANTERLNEYLDQLRDHQPQIERVERERQARLERERQERERLEQGERERKASQQTELTGVRVAETTPEHTRIVFDLSGQAEHDLFTLVNPSRVIIDLKGVRKSAALGSINKTSLLSRIRSAVRTSNDLRIVLDLSGMVRPRGFMLQPNASNGHRLVIDLFATQLSPTPVVTPVDERHRKKKKILIAIDPGHGGRDSGAVGHKGTQEKDITLSLAKKLELIINATPGYLAVMTRESDHYIGLHKRVEKARKHRADLFVSLHFDAFESPNVEGASVHVLSENGAQLEAARWFADKNSSDLKSGISLDEKDERIASALLDLSQTATIQDSLELGSHVLKNLGKVGKLNKKQVQQADLVELRAPDMTSIYVNIGNLANPYAERRLRSPFVLGKVATAIFSGIEEHVKNPLGLDE